MDELSPKGGQSASPHPRRDASSGGGDVCAEALPSRYEMPCLADRERSRGTAHRDLGDAHLPVDLLTQNAIWFYRLRWLVIALLLAIAALGEYPELVGRLGLTLDWRWPLAVAAVLTALNAGLVTLIVFGGTEAIERRPKLVLWVQIVVDLVALTVVIHFIGSLESFAAFAYLCHIVLACLFGSSEESVGERARLRGRA